MKKPQAPAEPPKLRSSPTGRIPQWAMDEALGRYTEPEPFRGPVSGGGQPGGRRSRRRPTLRTLCAVLAAAGVVGSALYLQVSGHSAGDQPAFSADAARNNTSPPPGLDEQSSPLGTPPSGKPTVEGVGYRFLEHQRESAVPVTWSPCRPVRYVVRQLNAPTGGASAISSALAEVGHATGLRFVDAGTTTEGPSEDRAVYQPARYGKRWAPVLIAWASPIEVPDFGVDILGEAGPISVRRPDGATTYVSGTVYLDPQKFAEIAASDGIAAAKVIILHELGHLVGLAHIGDPADVMFPRASAQVTTFGLGDLGGLAAVGRGPCQPDI